MSETTVVPADPTALAVSADPADPAVLALQDSQPSHCLSHESFRWANFARQLVTGAVLAYWLWLYGDTLVETPLLMVFWLDVLLLLVAWGRGCWHGHPPMDGLLFLVLSWRIHQEAQIASGGTSPFLSAAWLILLAVWGGARNPNTRYVLVFYHLGLSFEPGYRQTMGMGMPTAWEAGHLNLMLLSAVLQRLTMRPWPTSAARGRTALLLVGILWVLVWHSQSAGAGLTLRVAATLGIGGLFFLTCFPQGILSRDIIGVMSLGLLPICIDALQMSVTDAQSIAEFFGKRLMAGGLHPNVIAASLLPCLLLLWRDNSLTFFPKRSRRLVLVFLSCFFVLLLFLTGSRWSQLLCITAVAVVFSRRLARRWLLILPALTLAIGFFVYRSFSWQELFLNERLFIWRAAWSASLQQPWQGWGIMPFAMLPQVLPPDVAIWLGDWNYPHAHSLLLESMLAGGGPGLTCLLLVCWFCWQSLVFARVERLLLTCYLLLGLGDFPWAGPGTALLLLAILLAGPQPETARRKPAPVLMWLAFGLISLVLLALVPVNQPIRLYNQALVRRQAGDDRWLHSLHQCLAADPARLEPRLHLLLWQWSAGRPPSPEDRAALAVMREQYPQYYLLHFLEGRLEELNGNFAAAAAAFGRAVSLEPHDGTGIRWASLARAGQRLENHLESAFPLALMRHPWGPALLLDDPEAGPFWREQAAKCLLLDLRTTLDEWPIMAISAALQTRQLPPPAWKDSHHTFSTFAPTTQELWKLTGLTQTRIDNSDSVPGAASGQVVGAAIGTATDVAFDAASDVAASTASGIATSTAADAVVDAVADTAADDVADTAASSVPASGPASGPGTMSCSMDSTDAVCRAGKDANMDQTDTTDQSLPLSILMQMAERELRAGNPQAALAVANRAITSWNFRDKGNENQSAIWLQARALQALKQHHKALDSLARLMPNDPYNPWLHELLGDCQNGLEQTEQAVISWQQALQYITSARLDPFFAEGPRDMVGHTGDQWTYLFERALRRFERNTFLFHTQRWADLHQRIEKKIKNAPGT